MSRLVVNAQTGEQSIDSGFVAEDFSGGVEEKRKQAVLSRETFLIGCVSASIITEAEAEEAADGSWPSSFNAFLAGMTATQRIEAKALWASRANVRRDSPLLALVAANKGVTDAELDALFGIVG